MGAFDRLIARWPRTVHLWRTTATAEEGELRYGVMHKDGIRDDVLDSSYGFHGVVYVLRGTGRYHDGGESWPLRPGSVFQRLPDRRHTTILDPASRWVECYVCVGGELGRALMAGGVVDGRRLVVERGIDRDLAERVVAGLVAARAAAAWDLPVHLGRAIALMADLVHPPAGAVDPDERLLAGACERLGDDLDRPRSPRAVARELGCGYERFRKVFRRGTGVGPLRWRMRRRMDVARELLIDRDLSIAEVAARVGFADPTLFATRFRAHAGCSPRSFRQANA